MRIPYNQNFAALASKGEIICEKDETAKAMFAELLKKIGGVAK